MLRPQQPDPPEDPPAAPSRSAESDLSPSGLFCVAVHDVHPRFAREIAATVRGLGPLVGRKVAAAVVPRWHGDRIDAADADFRDHVVESFDEVLLHGCTHRRARPGGLVSALTRASDELGGASRDETITKLQDGQAVLTEVFGERAAGFVPPAWVRGPVTASLLRDAGIHYLVGMFSLEWTSGAAIRLATWSWDLGAARALGYCGEIAGRAARAMMPRAIPCVVLHPADVDRGFLPRGLRVIEALLGEGRRPLTFKDLDDPALRNRRPAPRPSG